ncbi:DUF5723 family protein [Owenweeksia hongkongensis]|uniref:DUF5723 family protein n=1 Tax=Owenweeksia hongkongensis TaxID=253245 RepID=UPI003A9355E7
MLRLRIYILIQFFLVAAYAQNQQGLQVSNYSGTSGLGYNPSSFQASPLKWDFTILSGGVFVETDYIFIKNTSINELFNTDKAFVNFNEEGTNRSSDIIYYQFRDAKVRMNNSISAFAGSPAFATHINKHFSVGFYAKMRQAFSANHLDHQLSEPSIAAWMINETRDIKPTRLTAMLWSEYALNLAYGYSKGDKVFSYGINAKFLVGNQAFFINSPSTLDLTKLSDDMEVPPAELQYGFTYFDEGFNLNNNGQGLGIDFGFTIQDKDYFAETGTWKVAAAIADLGFVNFKNNSEQHRISTDQVTTIPNNTFEQANSLQEFSRELSNALTGDPNTTYQGPRFTIFTPAALNVSVDYHLSKYLFANLNISRRFVLHPQQLQKENIAVTSIRYETRFIEVGLPITLYNDRNLRAGAWIRLGPLVVGSDNLAPWFMEQNQLSGADIYFALRINNWNSSLKNMFSNDRVEQCYW